MEVELKNIIDKIKQEGVEEAEKRGAEIVSKAHAEAGALLDGAKKEKEEIIKRAEDDAAKLKKNTEEALRQASRDVVLSLRENILKLFDNIIKRDVAGQLSPDVMKEMLIRLIESMTKDKNFDIEVLLSEKDRTVLENSLRSSLKGEMEKGLTIKISPNIEHGFRVGEKNGNAYYDFTDDAIAEAFKAYLNPKIARLLME